MTSKRCVISYPYFTRSPISQADLYELSVCTWSRKPTSRFSTSGPVLCIHALSFLLVTWHTCLIFSTFFSACDEEDENEKVRIKREKSCIPNSPHSEHTTPIYTKAKCPGGVKWHFYRSKELHCCQQKKLLTSCRSSLMISVFSALCRKWSKQIIR